jgi:hypothetical protein
MNAGSNSIAGFRLDDKRGLTPITGSIQPLGAGTNVPSQIQFDKAGRVLIVDERGSSTIVVDHRGVAGPAHATPSSAGKPFGFDVDRRGHILFRYNAGRLERGELVGQLVQGHRRRVALLLVLRQRSVERFSARKTGIVCVGQQLPSRLRR